MKFSLALLKTRLRDSLSPRVQVPLKYLLNYLGGSLEEELNLIPYLVSPGDRVVDVGGNRGVYTYYFWRHGLNVDVFEPNEVCLKVLLGWARNKTSITVHSVALSDVSGTSNLSIPLDSAGVEHDAAGTIREIFSGGMRQQPVTVKRLDDYGLEGVVFIKIDVEGQELKVLRGAHALLRKQQPAILVEVEQRHQEDDMYKTFRYLKNLGYSGYFLRGGRLVSIDSFNREADQNLKYLNGSKGAYVNNFFFLHQNLVCKSKYKSLFEVWGRS